MPPKNAKRNEKDRKRRADGLLRHQQDLAEEQAEIDHLHGTLQYNFVYSTDFHHYNATGGKWWHYSGGIT
jgi:hypothetical protein